MDRSLLISTDELENPGGDLEKETKIPSDKVERLIQDFFSRTNRNAIDFRCISVYKAQSRELAGNPCCTSRHHPTDGMDAYLRCAVTFSAKALPGKLFWGVPSFISLLSLHFIHLSPEPPSYEIPCIYYSFSRGSSAGTTIGILIFSLLAEFNRLWFSSRGSLRNG